VERVKVQSSNLDSAGYDEAARTLQIQFKGRGGKEGSVYDYANVPISVWHDFLQAPSKGQFFGARVKGLYSTTKIS
jgi:hypothetical protein